MVLTKFRVGQVVRATREKSGWRGSYGRIVEIRGEGMTTPAVLVDVIWAPEVVADVCEKRMAAKNWVEFRIIDCDPTGNFCASCDDRTAQDDDYLCKACRA